MRLDFLLELVRRRVIERYVGTSSRIVWVILSPLVPLLMNLLVFYYIARIPDLQKMSVAAYAAFVFSGLMPFRFVQKASGEGCDLLMSNMDMLKSAAFPLPFLGMTAVGALLVEFGIQCALMAVLMAVAGISLQWSILLLPFAIAAMIALALGASWLFSVAGYLLRDLQEILGVAFGALLYLTPAMYPPEIAPAFLQKFIWMNPLTHYVIAFRDAIMPSAQGPHWDSWAIVAALSIAVLGAGYAAIRRMRPVVGDLV